MAPPRSTETGSRELHVDPGPAPQLEQDPPEGDELAPEAPAPESSTLLGQLEEWETETVGLLVGGVLLVFHWTLGRGGPPDAFVPEDAERDAMARPLTRMLNRSERARRLASKGDGVAFATAFGGFVVKETKEVAEWRAEQGPAAPAPDADVAGLGVTESDVEVQGPLRRWRPPAVPPDEPPPT